MKEKFSPFARKEKQTILRFLRKKPHHIIMLWGGRQSGKTTLIKQALAEYSGESLYLNVDHYNEKAALQEFSRLHLVNSSKRLGMWLDLQWCKARERAKSLESPFVLVIDEIQKIPNWSKRVKALWDRDRFDYNQVHVVLLGSSPHLLQKGLSESMLGRYFEITSKHWSYSEMSEAFGWGVDEFIYYGGYPSSAQYIHNEDLWNRHIAEDIVRVNMHRDVLGLINIKYPKLIKKLFSLGAISSGKIMSYQDIMNNIKGHESSQIKEYLKILQEVYMLTGLLEYNERRASRKAPLKFQVLNTALMSYASGYSFQKAKANSEYWGRLVESAVGAHIVNTCHPDASVYYWKDDTMNVNFVIKRKPHLAAVILSNEDKKTIGKKLFHLKKNTPITKSIVIGSNHLSVGDFLSETVQEWCMS